jgi:hypothetical protein
LLQHQIKDTGNRSAQIDHPLKTENATGKYQCAMLPRLEAYNAYTARLTAAAAAHVPIPLAAIISEYARVSELTHFTAVISTGHVMTYKPTSLKFCWLHNMVGISHIGGVISLAPAIPPIHPIMGKFDDRQYLKYVIGQLILAKLLPHIAQDSTTANDIVTRLYESFIKVSAQGEWAIAQ